MSWIPPVLYDAKSKLAETWCNCIAGDTQSIPSAWWCAFPNGSGLSHWKFSGSGWQEAKAGQRNVTLLCNGGCGSLASSWLWDIGDALECDYFVWLFCLVGRCQCWAFRSFYRKQRDIQWLLTLIWMWRLTIVQYHCREKLCYVQVCNPECLKPLCVLFQASVTN